MKIKERLYTAEEVLKFLDAQRSNCWMAAQNAGIKEEHSSWKDILVQILNAPTPKISI